TSSAVSTASAISVLCFCTYTDILKSEGAYPTSTNTLFTTSLILIFSLQEISPATIILPFVANTSQATREDLSFNKQASKILSEIKSHSLSGWPAHTLSAVKYLIVITLPRFLYLPLRIVNKRSIISSCGFAPINSVALFSLIIW